jgi:hypothetical protein
MALPFASRVCCKAAAGTNTLMLYAFFEAIQNMYF